MKKAFDNLVNLIDKYCLSVNEVGIAVKELEAEIVKAVPTERQKMVERASIFLSNGEISIEEMCDRIAQHEDSYDLIDNVADVVVWEKVESRFTCDNFLQEIGYVK